MEKKRTSKWLAVMLAACLMLAALVPVFAEGLPSRATADTVDYSQSLIKGMNFNTVSGGFPRSCYAKTPEDYAKTGGAVVRGGGTTFTDGALTATQYIYAQGFDKTADSRLVFTYDLGAEYDLTSVTVQNYKPRTSGADDRKNLGWDFYAGTTSDITLYTAENKTVGREVGSENYDQVIPVSYKKVRYISFVMQPNKVESGYNGGYILIGELAVFGARSSSGGETTDLNLIPNVKGQGTVAPGGVVADTKDITFESEYMGYTLPLLADGDKATPVKMFGFADGDLPGVRYDLGSVRDLSKLALYVPNADGEAVTGVKMFASPTLEALYQAESMVYEYAGGDSIPNLHEPFFETPVNARYVAFVLTGAQNGFVIRECEIYGSGDPLEAYVPTPTDPDTGAEPPTPAGSSLISGAVGQGVAAVDGRYDNVKDVFFTHPTTAEMSILTDGDLVQNIFFDGATVEAPYPRGVRYDLGQVCSIEQVRMYVTKDVPYAVSGVRVYASENLEDLYASKNLVYCSENNTTLNALKYKALDAPKAARYVAFMMTQTTPAGGINGWRAMEFEVYGQKDETLTISADAVNGSVTGTGSYQMGDTVTLTAAADEGYVFTGWYEGAQLLSSDMTYTFTAQRSMQLTAKFEPIPQGSVTIAAEGGGAMTVTAQGQTSQAGQSFSGDYQWGTQVRLEALDSSDALFLYWKDQNGNRVSAEKAFSFTVSGDHSYTAVFKAPDMRTVTFMSAGNQILKVLTLNPQTAVIGDVAFPADIPARYGYQATGNWSMTAQGILDAIQATDVVVTPEYQKTVAYHTVTAAGGTVTGTQNPDAANQFEEMTVAIVTADPAENGKKFSHWEITGSGEVVSTSETYTFYVTTDVQLSAVYVAQDDQVRPVPVVRITDIRTDAQNHKMTFVAERFVPKGYQVLAHGILLTRESSVGEDLDGFVRGASGVFTSTATTTGNQGGFAYTVTGVDTGVTWYARGYVVFMDADGRIFTIYGGVSSAVMQ